MAVGPCLRIALPSFAYSVILCRQMAGIEQGCSTAVGICLKVALPSVACFIILCRQTAGLEQGCSALCRRACRHEIANGMRARESVRFQSHQAGIARGECLPALAPLHLSWSSVQFTHLEEGEISKLLVHMRAEAAAVAIRPLWLIGNGHTRRSHLVVLVIDVQPHHKQLGGLVVEDTRTLHNPLRCQVGVVSRLQCKACGAQQPSACQELIAWPAMPQP